MTASLTPADCPAAAVISGTAPESWSAGALADTLQSGSGRLFGFWQDGELAGVAVFRLAADEAALESLTLLPAVRGQGLSRGFLRDCLDVLRAQGAARCCLEVRAGNAPAIALYQGLGFIPAGRRKNFYRDPAEDAIVYTLEF